MGQAFAYCMAHVFPVFPPKASSSLTLILGGLLFVFSFLQQTAARAQTDLDTEKQLYFFRVWGFVKYHHPAFATGQIEADSLFLRYLPAFDEAKSQKEVNAVVHLMLEEVGVPATVKTDPPQDDLEHTVLLQNLNHQWRTRSRFLNSANRKLLDEIFERRFTGEKHHYTYVTNSFYGGTMPHEPAYALPKEEAVPFPLRMLALAKFSAFVAYLYPHQYLLPGSWEATVQALVPVFAQADDRLKYEAALLSLNARLHDTHAFPFFRQLLHKEDLFKNKYYPPFNYRVIDKQLLVTSLIDPALCERANIQVGDVLVELDDQPIDVWVTALDNVLSVSNPSALWAKIGEWGDNLLFRSSDPDMKVLLLRGGRDFLSVNLRLMDPSTSSQANLIDAYFKKRLTPAKKRPGLRWLNDSIVYFPVHETERLTEDVPLDDIARRMDSLLTAATQAKGLVFDMRSAPDNSDFIFEHLFRKFGTGANFFARYYLLNRTTPGTYQLLTQPEAYFPTSFPPQGAAYTGKVVVLVNGATQGIGEWLTMNLQHLFPQAITIGEQTAGADGDVKKIVLPGNYTLELTGNAVFYPDMTSTQRQGIRLNEVVKTTMKGIQEQRDEVLDRALELIREE